MRWRSDCNAAPARTQNNPLLPTHPSFDSFYGVWELIRRVGGITQTPALSPNMDRSHFTLPERRDPLLLPLCCCCFFNEHSCNPHQQHPPPPLPHDKSRLAGHVWPQEDEERFVGGFGFFIRASVYLYERPGCCWAISTQRLFLNQWAVTVRWMKRFHLSWDTEHCFGQGGSVK